MRPFLYCTALFSLAGCVPVPSTNFTLPLDEVTIGAMLNTVTKPSGTATYLGEINLQDPLSTATATADLAMSVSFDNNSLTSDLSNFSLSDGSRTIVGTMSGTGTVTQNPNSVTFVSNLNGTLTSTSTTNPIDIDVLPMIGQLDGTFKGTNAIGFNGTATLTQTNDNDISTGTMWGHQ